MTILLLEILALVAAGAITVLIVAICAMGVSMCVRLIISEWKEAKNGK